MAFIETAGHTKQQHRSDDAEGHDPDPERDPIVRSVPAWCELGEEGAGNEILLAGLQDQGSQARPKDGCYGDDPDDGRGRRSMKILPIHLALRGA